MKMLILGPQGSGKGTQAKKIAEAFELKHISTGDIFRENIKNQTELGKLAKSFIDQGKLVPDEVTNKIVEDAIKGKDDFILDGFPRNMMQAEVLENVTQLDYAVEVQLEDEDVLLRLSGRRTCRECGEIYHINFKPSKKFGECDHDAGELYQRDDDKPDAITKRLEIYHLETEPILDFYKKKKILITINGDQPIEKVFEDIKEALEM
jgi:adenylate kinase